MDKTPVLQLFALSEDADPVKIGDIIEVPDLHEQTTLSLEQCKATLTAAVNMDPADVRRFHGLCAAPAVAECIAEKLRNMQSIWHAKIKYMPRADRRAYRRAFIKELKKFKAYCAANGITYTIQ
jgi:enamine deaminase RidA (YjgF/YER057c/UK114 family)